MSNGFLSIRHVKTKEPWQNKFRVWGHSFRGAARMRHLPEDSHPPNMMTQEGKSKQLLEQHYEVEVEDSGRDSPRQNSHRERGKAATGQAHFSPPDGSTSTFSKLFKFPPATCRSP